MTKYTHTVTFETDAEARKYMLDFLKNKQSNLTRPTSQRYATRYDRCGVLKGTKISYALSNTTIGSQKQ